MEHLQENLDFLLFALLVLGIFIGLHLWLRKRSDASRGAPRAVWLLVLAVLGIGAVKTDRMGHEARARLEQALLGFAPTYAMEIERLGHAHIDLDTPGDDPAYLAMIEAERRWLAVNPVVNDIYTVRRTASGHIALIVDSETDYDRNGRIEGDREARTDIGELLDVEGPVLSAAFAGKGGFDPQVSVDRWGTWVSAYWPMHDAKGRVEALLAVDYDARDWTHEINKARWNAMVATMVIVLSLFGATLLYALMGIELDMRRKSAEALAAARDAAESASALKSQFLARMSHEIRTPINGVMGVTELLLQTSLDHKQHHFGNLIYRSATTLLDVINDILDYSKIEAGKLELEQIAFDPREVFEDVVELLAARAQGKGLDLNLDLPVETQSMLRGDPARLRQIVTNLVGNAIKFTTEGEVTVVVTWPAVGALRGALRCEVRDTGPGIDPSSRSSLFEPFVQADSSTTRRFGGTGLGLAICKRLILAMGGEIGCEARSGGGSLFWFEVPLACIPRSASGVLPERRFSLQGIKALIVDDNATNREILQHVFDAWGIRHSCAVDAKDALAQLEAAAAGQEPYVVAVLDLDLPKIDGLELARRIKRSPALRNTRLMMLSSVCHMADPDAWRAAGIESYLTKPVRQNNLFCALTELLGMGADELAAQPAPFTPPPPAALHFAGRVLLAEDNAVNQLVAREILSGLGFAVETVANGRDAVTAVQERGQSFELILMDCEMPELDGRAASAAIRAFEASHDRVRLPIVALTAHAMESDRESCLEAGMDDFLSKPFTGQQLAATLARWVQPAAAGRGLSDEQRTSSAVPA